MGSRLCLDSGGVVFKGCAYVSALGRGVEAPGR